MDLKQIYTSKVYILPSSSAVGRMAADYVVKLVQRKPNAVLMFAAGNSTRGMLETLITDYRQKRVDFSRVTIVGLDEYWPIKPDDPISTEKRMWESFHSKVTISRAQLVLPNGNAADLNQELERFSHEVKRVGPFDLSVVGMGPGKTCHVGMNNPGSSIASRVRSIMLDRESRDAMMKKLNLPDNRIPQKGITLGIADILESKEILMLALGESKAWGVKRSLEGIIDEESPASLLRHHANTTFILDTEAASLLTQRPAA